MAVSRVVAFGAGVGARAMRPTVTPIFLLLVLLVLFLVVVGGGRRRLGGLDVFDLIEDVEKNGISGGWGRARCSRGDNLVGLGKGLFFECFEFSNVGLVFVKDVGGTIFDEIGLGRGGRISEGAGCFRRTSLFVGKLSCNEVGLEQRPCFGLGQVPGLDVVGKDGC